MTDQRTKTVQDPSKPVRRAMIVLASAALIAFLTALTPLHPLPPGSPPVVHMIMAAGIMPLIMGAMIYFTPVLTHSRMPLWPILAVPLLALSAGVLVTTGLLWWRDLLAFPAAMAILAAGVLLGWMWRRAHNMLGRPHPGLRWYLWALAGLLLGLMAIFIAILRPEYGTALRRFHLHINILGFVGLTAVGTLRVLVPTVAGYADAEARERLHADLYPVAAGAVLVAAGSAWWTWLVWPGLVLWLVPLVRFALPLVAHRRKSVWGWHRPGTSLGLAVFGLMIVLVAGGLHAAAMQPAGVTAQLFFYVFLLPLVTGAISYLLPVWVWPARNTPAYENAARRLAYASGARAILFLAAGILVASGVTGAAYPAVAGLAAFLMQVIGALLARFPASI